MTESLEHQRSANTTSSESPCVGSESSDISNEVGAPLSSIKVYALPFDILYAIFILCNNHSIKFRITASQVCRLWRLSAIESPALWSTIQFIHKRPSWEKYEMWLARSRDAPLTIEISGVPFGGSSIKNLKRILRLIVPHAARWLSISIIGVPDKIFRIAIERILCVPVPMLQTMKLSLQKDDIQRWRRPTHFAYGTPALRHLVLERVPIHLESSILSNLTTLKIRDGRPGTPPPLPNFKILLRSILTRSPDLHTLHFRTAGDPSSSNQSDSSSSSAPELLVHHGLHVLELTPSTIPQFLEAVQVPALARIDFDESLRGIPLSFLTTFARWFTPSALDFAAFNGGPRGTVDPLQRHHIHSLPEALNTLSALKHLFFFGVDFGLGRVACLGWLCPQLMNLSLRECIGVTGDEIQTLVSARQDSDNVIILRNLENLEVGSGGPPIVDRLTQKCMEWMGYSGIKLDLLYRWVHVRTFLAKLIVQPDESDVQVEE